MKKIALIAVIALAAWWYFAPGSRMTEDGVRAFYRDLQVATLRRQPDAICALLAEEYRSVGSIAAGGQRATSEQDKAQACAAQRDLYAAWEKLGEKMGGILQLDSGYTIHGIEVSRDGKTATAEVSSTLDVGGSIMNMRSRSTDTLVLRKGKVRMLRSEGTGAVGGG